MTRSSKRDAERDQKIGLGHAHVGGVAAVHAGHTDEVGMLRWQSAETHQRVDGGRIESFHQFAQLFRCVRGDDASPGVDERALGLEHHLSGAPDLAVVAFRVDFVSG